MELSEGESGATDRAIKNPILEDTGESVYVTDYEELDEDDGFANGEAGSLEQRQLAGAIFTSELGGNQPEFGHDGESRFVSKDLKEGENESVPIDQAPEEYINEIDREEFVQETAIAALAGNNDPHADNVAVDEEGNLTVFDHDRTGVFSGGESEVELASKDMARKLGKEILVGGSDTNLGLEEVEGPPWVEITPESSEELGEEIFEEAQTIATEAEENGQIDKIEEKMINELERSGAEERTGGDSPEEHAKMYTDRLRATSQADLDEEENGETANTGHNSKSTSNGNEDVDNLAFPDKNDVEEHNAQGETGASGEADYGIGFGGEGVENVHSPNEYSEQETDAIKEDIISKHDDLSLSEDEAAGGMDEEEVEEEEYEEDEEDGENEDNETEE